MSDGAGRKPFLVGTLFSVCHRIEMFFVSISLYDSTPIVRAVPMHVRYHPLKVEQSGNLAVLPVGKHYIELLSQTIQGEIHG